MARTNCGSILCHVAREVEIKFLVADIGALETRLRERGFRQVTPPAHEMNTLYDTSDRRLRRAGELLRIRRYGDRWILTHKAKGKTGTHKSRVETETEVADGESLAQILRSLGFSPSFRYEKFRSEWTDSKGHVVIDRTPIGNVAEIEGKPDWIDATAAALGVSRAQYITANYAQMFMEWKRRTGSQANEMTFAALGVTP
ncbi:MAG: class IV adenylate cyclase [Terriglobales bacterium]